MNLYIASRLYYAERWRRLRDEWNRDGIFIISRWIDLVPLEDANDSNVMKFVWSIDETDVRNSHALLLYAEPRDTLRGALVEAGMAIAFGHPVFLVGDNSGFGTWQHHPQVHKFATLKLAKKLLLVMKG